MSDLNILGIIPARGGSKGIPDKNCRPLKGIPLVSRACRCALNSSLLSHVVLSTDSEKIAEIGRSEGVEVPFLRPTALAQDESPAVDYVRHCIDYFSDIGTRPDIVVLIQPTTPFRLSQDIDACLDMLVSSDADSVVSVCQVPGHFHPDWQLCAGQGGLETMAGEKLATLNTHRQSLGKNLYRNGAVYAFHTRVFEETGFFYGTHCLGYEMDAMHSVNIDDPLDWLMAEAVAKHLNTLGES